MLRVLSHKVKFRVQIFLALLLHFAMQICVFTTKTIKPGIVNCQTKRSLRKWKINDRGRILVKDIPILIGTRLHTFWKIFKNVKFYIYFIPGIWWDWWIWNTSTICYWKCSLWYWCCCFCFWNQHSCSWVRTYNLFSE